MKTAVKRSPRRAVKKREADAFAQYLTTLPAEDAAAVKAFFAEVRDHLALPGDETKRLCGDFENALLCLVGGGLPLSEALDRLAVRHLGGFYARPAVLWYPLDDAAKIYPLSMKHGQMAVFRLSACLRDPIVPALLQMALTFTVKRFPSFATTVKKGFFWHYLDAAKHRYAVEPETDLPCRPLRIAGSGAPSFRVLYYQDRISVEFFHILTDGSGGMEFLKTLCAEYLRLTGVEDVFGDGVRRPDAAPAAAETANEFSRADPTDRRSGFLDKPALQMGGRLSQSRPCRVVHFHMDADGLHAAAKARGATVTAYLLSRLFAAGRAACDETDGDFNIQVPVNMRKFYPSPTVRNFSQYCGIRLPASACADPDAVLPEIARQLAEKAAKPAMDEMLNSTLRLVGLVRHVPLRIKAPIARLAFGFLGDRIFTNTLSNLGVVALPAAMAAKIRHMDFVLGPPLSNRAACAMITLNGVANLSVTENTADPTFCENLCRLFAADGVEVRLEGSALYEA